jgi:hypothetical protein
VNKGYHQYHFEMEIYLEKSILWRQFAVNIKSQIIYSFEGNETKGRKQNRQIRLMFHMPEEEET